MSRNLVFGLHAVEALLKRSPGEITQLWLQDSRQDRRLAALQQQAQAAGIRIAVTNRAALDELVEGGRHQGVVAAQAGGREWQENDLPALLDGLAEPPFLLILDGVQDPHNLGACLRSADAAGVHAVIAPKDRASGLTATARKVACGAAEALPFIQVTNLARCLRELKDRGIWLVGAAGEADAELYGVDLRGPLALVLGAEEKGLRRLTREHCDSLVRIPMRGSVSSLNVSVATGVLLFEALRQRRTDTR